MTQHRFLAGAGRGLLATIAMSALMLIGLATGMSPMPRPIPAAIMARLLGPDLGKPVLMGLAIVAHLGYGAVAGGLFALIVARITVPKGLLLGVVLWLLMQVVVLPLLGWGAFGAGITPKIAVATLILHLVYGATYGALMDRQIIPASPESSHA